MKRARALLIAGLAAAGLVLAQVPEAEAQKAPAKGAANPAKGAANCVSKGGRGTGSNEENAKFQAWEAVLQATDWGMWSVWITSSWKVGQAPGYAVSNLKTKCGKGGSLGHECIIWAKLCK